MTDHSFLSFTDQAAIKSCQPHQRAFPGKNGPEAKAPDIRTKGRTSFIINRR